MFLKKEISSRVLITTPDYPPRLGGLSTFTVNIESVLQQLGLGYDLYVWESGQNLLGKKSINKKYDYAFHIHFMGAEKFSSCAHKNICFIHGSEILFYSPNKIKHFIKKLLKKKFLNALAQSYLNVFISDFTLNKIESVGHVVAYDRDIVFHNCIDVKGHKKQMNSLSENEISFICVARDVPHKNLKGAYEFVKIAAKKLNKRVVFYVTAEFTSTSDVEVIPIKNISNDDLDDLYVRAHFNLLLSLDHSHRGFYEGFGLTVLEAARFATPSIVSPYGGLPEAVEHLKTGWCLNDLSPETMNRFWEEFSIDSYEAIADYCYEHTLSCHDLSQYRKLFSKVFGQ